MNGKERCYAIIGGCVGAVLTLVVCSLSPLGAQSQSDVNFGKITCAELEVMGPDRTRRVSIAALKDGGVVRVYSRNDQGVRIFASESRGHIRVYGEDDRYGKGDRSVSISVNGYGGRIIAHGKHGKGVNISINEDGGHVGVYHTNGLAAAMNIGGHGGQVGVYGKRDGQARDRHQRELRALMSVTESGNGVVSTWDKDGYHMK